ncbi:MAG: hypothetical protein LBS12_00955 [Prevotellaceae bacterium]|jgi:hypothetical protein|nr:hypothetical protein [Prevotellaceae bacterium]
MKKNFLMTALVSLFTVVAISSCNKDDDDDDQGGGIDNTITATVENGSSLNGKIDLVEVVVYRENGISHAVASAPYSNGGFTLTLPETVGDMYLDAFEDMPVTMTVSDYNVKTSQADIRASKAGVKTGWFYHGTPEWAGILIYSTGDVSVTGTSTDTYTYDANEDGVNETYTEIWKYDVQLKKGWNMMYIKEIEKGNNTIECENNSIVPSGAKWYYEED